jgi:hypothetical protein
MMMTLTSRSIYLFLLVFFVLSISFSTEARSLPEFKPNGISLEWYQHELDLGITQVNTPLLSISAQQLETIKRRLKTLNEIEVVSVRLDRQLRPYLNIFGSIGKVTDVTTVDFSRLNSLFSDLVVDNNGTAYTMGATLKRHHGHWLTSIQYIHSRIHRDNNSEEIVVNTVVPTLGYQTHLGTFSTSLAYQGFKAVYSGIVTVPIVGDVPVEVTTENSDHLQLLAGYHTQIVKDLYINMNVGLNGQKQIHLQLNKRF